jgi:hypothetical protein
MNELGISSCAGRGQGAHLFWIFFPIADEHAGRCVRRLPSGLATL